jgi:hypothetical protein
MKAPSLHQHQVVGRSDLLSPLGQALSDTPFRLAGTFSPQSCQTSNTDPAGRFCTDRWPSSYPRKTITALNHEIIRKWVSPADTRGTASILYTCVLTIVLCVCTAVHIDIPALGESVIRHWLRKAKWTVLGIVAPELVLLTAWSQFYNAWDLVKQINHAVKRPSTDPLYSGHAPDFAITNEPLNLRYGFFAVVGGFRANVAAFGEEFTSLPLTRFSSISSRTGPLCAYRERYHCRLQQGRWVRKDDHMFPSNLALCRMCRPEDQRPSVDIAGDSHLGPRGMLSDVIWIVV